MSKDRVENYSGFLAVATWLAFLVWMVSFSYGQWGDAIKAQRHRRDWTIHTGTVVSVEAPNYSQDPPSTPSDVAFRDFFGRPQRVRLDLPYGWHAGDTLPIDVGSNGSIFAPQTVDWVDQAQSDPLKVNADFWPGAAILVGAILSIAVGVVSFWLYLPLLMYLSRPVLGLLKKRRQRRHWQWSSEELRRREREVGIDGEDDPAEERL